MGLISGEVETRLNSSRLRAVSVELIRDFLDAAVTADPALSVLAGDPRWAAIDILRSGQSVGRIFVHSGKIQISNFILGSKSGDYGPDVPLGDKGQWTFVLKKEDDADRVLRCLADNIAHLSGRRVRPHNGSSVQTGVTVPAPAAPGERNRRTLPRSTRFAVLVRDAYTCQYCGRRAPEVELHVDHRKPVSQGGSDTLDNLVAACVDCNLGKSNRHST